MYIVSHSAFNLAARERVSLQLCGGPVALLGTPHRENALFPAEQPRCRAHKQRIHETYHMLSFFSVARRRLDQNRPDRRRRRAKRARSLSLVLCAMFCVCASVRDSVPQMLAVVVVVL